MFGCIAFCGPEWTWQPDPPLWLLALYTLSIGAIGMLTARRRPILSAVFILFVLLSALDVYLELRDSYAEGSTLRVAGYASGSALAIMAGISISVLGALVGARKVHKSMEAWRWTSGGSGIALLGLTLFAASKVARTTYYEYFGGKKYAFIGRFAYGHNAFGMRWQGTLAELSGQAWF